MNAGLRRLQPGSSLGRHGFGLAALAFGLVALAWPDHYDTLQSHSFLNAQEVRDFGYAASAAQLFGGVAIQFPRSAKAGALALGTVYLIIALLSVPPIIAKPQIYNNWGNFFEQLSLATGGVLVYARLSSTWSRTRLNTVGRLLLGICVVSFTLEQALYLDNTAPLVPRWLPPSQMFWAVTTTAAFGLAAIALLTNIMALLAARLLTLMLVLFGLIVWVPLLLSAPDSHANWSETIETFAIAGVAWILADLLGHT